MSRLERLRKRFENIDNEIIMSFTSYPRRFNAAKQIIETYLSYKFRADKLILYLSKSECTDKDLHYFDNYISSSKHYFEVHTYDDILGPYGKLLPAIKEYPNKYILIFDDDTIIPEERFKLYSKSRHIFPNCVLNTHPDVAVYNNNSFSLWEYEKSWMFNTMIKMNKPQYGCISLGVLSVLYPPNFGIKNNNSYQLNFLNNKDIYYSDTYKTSDDIWFFICEMLFDIQSVTVSMEFEFNTVKGFDKLPKLSDVNISKDIKNVDITAKNNIVMHRLLQDFPEIFIYGNTGKIKFEVNDASVKVNRPTFIDPIKTEEIFCNEHKCDPKYAAIGWNKYIHKYVLNNYKLITPKNLTLDIIKDELDISKQYDYTCFQDYNFMKYVDGLYDNILKPLGIKIIYTPFKEKGVNYIRDIELRPLSLYGRNCKNTLRSLIVLNNLTENDILQHEKKYDFSFIGSDNCLIRKKIFNMCNNDNNKLGSFYILKSNSSDNYNNIMYDSKYGLCPCGNGNNSSRIVECLSLATIPIILADTLDCEFLNYNYLPEMQKIDNKNITNVYYNCCIIIQEKNYSVKKIYDIINLIDYETFKKMQQNCLIIYKNISEYY